MFRFSIRDVLWLTVVVALSVGWWLDNRRLNELARRFKADAYFRRAVDDPQTE
jgi:hypothetical protein